MGYDLRAVIGGTQNLRRVVADLAAARLTGLGHGLSLVPMTDELFDSVTDGSSADSLGFCFLPGGFAEVLARWSRAWAIAYAEAEYAAIAIQRIGQLTAQLLCVSSLTAVRSSAR